MFLVVVGLVVAATLASALAWSGVGLIAFVPLVGLAVFPLQIAALLLRGSGVRVPRPDRARRLPHALSGLRGAAPTAVPAAVSHPRSDMA